MTFKSDLLAGRIKKKAQKDAKYLDDIRQYPCMVTGQNAEPHHIKKKGYSKTGDKASDYLAFPLSRDPHNDLHKDVKKWEERYWDQWKCVAYTQRRWIEEHYPDKNMGKGEWPEWNHVTWEEIALIQMQWLIEKRKK